MYVYLKTVVNSDYTLSWICKVLSDENITPPCAPHNFLFLSLNYLGTKIRVRYSGSWLKENKIIYNHGKIVHIYIVSEINKNYNTTSSDPTLENCLFRRVSLTKNCDIDQYNYSRYGIGFDGDRSYSGKL